MNNIRKIITERLENAINDYHTYWDDLDMALSLSYKLEGQIQAYQDCLNLFPTPRTETDILNDFEKLGYEVNEENNIIYLTKEDVVLKIERDLKRYSKYDDWFYERPYMEITMQEHKLLNELFEVWGW